MIHSTRQLIEMKMAHLHLVSYGQAQDRWASGAPPHVRIGHLQLIFRPVVLEVPLLRLLDGQEAAMIFVTQCIDCIVLPCPHHNTHSSVYSKDLFLTPSSDS